jgi:prepilin-type N-terminal cleavage/methylation domain-containing protein
MGASRRIALTASRAAWADPALNANGALTSKFCDCHFRRDFIPSGMATAEGLCYSSRMLRRKAFTLIELLLVIGIIAVLAGIVITAVNPRLQLANAQDAKRRADARTIQQALEQYLVDNGTLPNASSIPIGSTVMICKQGLSFAGCVNLDSLVPTYAAAIPQDTTVLDANHSGFTVQKDAYGRPSVLAAYIGAPSGGSPSDYVGRWKLQDNAASTTVAAAVGGNGTLFGGDNTSILSVPGPGGAYPLALQLDGTNDYISMAHAGALNAYPLTVTLWVKTGANDAAYRGIVTKYLLGSGNGWSLHYKSGDSLNWYFKDLSSHAFGGGDGISGGSIADGAWHHLAMVVSPSGLQMYRDATPQGSIAWTGTAGATSTTESLMIGNLNGSKLNGAIADVRVYNRALSAAEIAALAAGL